MVMLTETSGEGMPLVLVPGGLTGWVSWIPFAERLSATRKVVRVQLLNVQLGLQGKPLLEDYSPAAEKQALAKTMESLDLMPPVDLAGWSYGAAIALDFALDHPEWVRTLTLIEPGAYWALPALDAEMQRQRDEYLRLSRDDVSEDDLEHFLHEAGLVPSGTNPRDLPDWPVWVQHRQSLRMLASFAEYHRDRESLSRFTTPTLLVKGTESTQLDRRIVDTLADQLPNSQVAELPGDHASHIVSMDLFLGAWQRFRRERGEPLKSRIWTSQPKAGVE
jgi:pimeloyl-ACP methyl ester carboxylesterase